jgi:hypothetical protein
MKNDKVKAVFEGTFICRHFWPGYSYVSGKGNCYSICAYKSWKSGTDDAGHMRIQLNLGMNEPELREMLSLIEAKVGEEEGNDGRHALKIVTNSGARQNTTDTTKSNSNIFTRGVNAPSNNFTGIVWVNMLVQAQDQLDCSLGVVTFEPGARRLPIKIANVSCVN